MVPASIESEQQQAAAPGRPGATTAQGRRRKPLTVRRQVSADPLSAADVAGVERLLARLVAEAYLLDLSRAEGGRS
jgi:hypothetical protein